MSPFYFCLVGFFRWCWNKNNILDKAMMSWYKLTYLKVIGEVNLCADVSLYSLHDKCNNFTDLLTDT